jgi:hypothetical protein
MKAIINIHKKNQYAKYNGLTFEVKYMGCTYVGLKGLDTQYPENQCDFSFNEVIIVDIQEELRLARESTEYNALSRYQDLVGYCIAANINPEFWATKPSN